MIHLQWWMDRNKSISLDNASSNIAWRHPLRSSWYLNDIYLKIYKCTGVIGPYQKSGPGPKFRRRARLTKILKAKSGLARWPCRAAAKRLIFVRSGRRRTARALATFDHFFQLKLEIQLEPRIWWKYGRRKQGQGKASESDRHTRSSWFLISV